MWSALCLLLLPAKVMVSQIHTTRGKETNTKGTRAVTLRVWGRKMNVRHSPRGLATTPQQMLRITGLRESSLSPRSFAINVYSQKLKT